MRITNPLFFPQRVRRLKDASWMRWRKKAIWDFSPEEKLKALGIQVEDANEYVKKHVDVSSVDARSLPDVDPIFPQPPKQDSSHPSWKDQPCKIVNSEVFPIYGVNQAQNFAKCIQLSKGLPDSYFTQVNDINFEEHVDRASRSVKQAFLWDAYLEKLPKLRDFDYPTISWRLKFGIPLKRSCEILLRNWIRLAEMSAPTEARNKALLPAEPFCVNLKRYDLPVQFKLTPLLSVLGKKPTPNCANNEIVQSTDGMDVPDIYPFLSTANFEDSNIYDLNDYCPLNPSVNLFPFLNMAIFCHDIPGSHTHLHPRWNDDRFKGTTVLYGFATALQEARRRFGNPKGCLPEPVTVQIVHTLGKEFQFAVFQLNNVDLEEDSTATSRQLKNIVWITEKMQLFSKCEYECGKEVLEDYNHDVFKTFFAMYLAGMK